MHTKQKTGGRDEPGPIAEALEEVASEKLGVERWDRPAIFREAAEAATDNDLAYWLVLLLSGAIAALGLALNSSAVVIGAMLVAPLLAPVMGLALAFAVGDSRLAIQTGVVVLGSTAAVILVGALVTLLLPFPSVTLEISTRTRPTTLDLAVAVCSGLVAALVTVTRRHRLSTAVPGVAIAVALIPPLAVAGYGVGAGWNWRLIHGSLLLYGANLAGIVLSGMIVFLLVGMQRAPVTRAARAWHREGPSAGLAGWIDRFRWVRTAGVMHSTWTRISLVVGFVVVMAVPLSQTLGQLTREARVRAAVEATAEMFNLPGRSSIINRQLLFGDRRTDVYLRVATTEWFDEEARGEFEEVASRLAGETVALVLEQLPVTGGDIADLASLFPLQDGASRTAPAAEPGSVAELLASARARLLPALRTLPLPEEVEVLETALIAGEAGRTTVEIAYLAPVPLSAEARQILGRQLAATAGDAELAASFVHLAAPSLPLDPAAPDTARLGEIASLVRRFPRLRAELRHPVHLDSAEVRRALELLRRHGIDPVRVVLHPDPGLTLRLHVE